MAYCTQCSEPLRSGVQFCPHCGAVVKKRKSKRHIKKKERTTQRVDSSIGSKKTRRQKTAEKTVNRRAFIIKVGAKSLGKSLALSAGILGPGFILLSSGYQIVGMAWLFLGSFGLMAWTYRKPWRLGLLSCLIPPTASASCYLLQLVLFSRSLPPPVLLLAAVGIGIAVGYWRARTHEVTRDENDGVIAQRTIGYLLVWVAAYGITQMLGLLAVSIYAVQAGLVTGAFSTSMLIIVSLIVWHQYKSQQLTSTPSTLVIFLFIPVVIACLAGSVHAKIYPDEVIDRFILEAGFKYKGQSMKKTSSTQSRDKFSKSIGTSASIAYRELRGQVNKYNGMQVVFGLMHFDSNDFAEKAFTKIRNKAIHNQKTIQYQSKHRPTTKTIRLPAYTFLNMQDSPGGARGVLLAYQGSWVLILRAREWNDDAGFRKISLENYLVDRARSILPNLPSVSSSFSTSSSNNSGSITDGNDVVIPPPTPGIKTETIAKVMSAVSAILIAAGIAINVAQAIAAAIANALQAGVQFTTEEIQRAVDDARLVDMPVHEHAPLVPKGPDYYDKEGDPFERNEDGEYWAPDDKGNWRWLGEKEAREAEAALRGERLARKAEQRHHERETDRMLKASRDKILAANQQKEDEYLRRKLQQQEADAALQDHRERLVAQADKLAEREGGNLEKEIEQLIQDGSYDGLEDLYREKLEQQITSGESDSADEQNWEKVMAVGENISRGVVAASKGALMVAGGPAGAAATGMAVGTVSAAEHGAESYVRGDSMGEVAARTAGGFLSGAKDGALSVYTNLPDTGRAVKLLVPAGFDAAETFVRTGDGKQALASAAVSIVGDTLGGKIDGIGNMVVRETASAGVTVAAAEATNYAAGGNFGDAYQTALVNHLGGKAGSRAGIRFVSKAVGVGGPTPLESPRVDHEQRVRQALGETEAEKTDIPLKNQARIIQELEQSRHREVVTDESGRPRLDADGNEETTSFVNSRKALEQLQDPSSSRSAKSGPEELKQAIIDTRQKKIYDPADSETIRRVTPVLEQEGLLKPGDTLEMDSFSTPGQKPSLGADRDARLVIKRPNGKPVTATEDGFDRIEIDRKHWEDIALEDFFKHTTKIAKSGGQEITPETQPEYFRRRAEMEFMKRPETPEEIAALQQRGFSQEQIAGLQQQGMTREQIDHKAWAEAHNQLFTDRHHMEASADNADQAFVKAEQGLDKVQVESNVMPVADGKSKLLDPEGFARMWKEKSHFYDHNPAEALAQSQKGLKGLMRLRDGYRAQGLAPPPFTERTAGAMELVARAKVGADATPETIADLNHQMQGLGYKDLNDGLAKIAYQNELLKWSTKVKGLNTSDLTRISQSSPAPFEEMKSDAGG